MTGRSNPYASNGSTGSRAAHRFHEMTGSWGDSLAEGFVEWNAMGDWGLQWDNRSSMSSSPPQEKRPRRPPPSNATLVVRGVALVVVVLVVLRLTVLVGEAYTIIASERSADDELVELCANGRGGRSAHMRQACMGAAVDRSGYALARAINRGVYAFGADLYALVGSPFRSGVWASACIALSIVPWLGPVKAFLWPTAAVAAAAAPEHKVIILHNGGRADGLTEATRRRGLMAPPMLEDVSLDEESRKCV